MKKIKLVLLIFFIFSSKSSAENIIPIIEGNRSAKIKLIVYESLTCSHCANFHNEVYPLLKKEFIEKGLVNIEFRNFPLDLAALNGSKLAHCKNDGNSKILHTLYKNQNKWIRGNNILDINKNLGEVIKENNLNINMESCFKNKKIEDHILQERIDGSKKYDIKSTPTLIINGEKFDKKLNYKNLEKILKKMI